ncbi:MAG: CRISPR-associated protein [Candidatus Methanoperedens sp.]|nr:CRISPR-associated protein [Candidatus Methanoperedens sp.]
MNLIFELKLLSDTLIGSGEGWGANIDSDIVFDDIGLPYIPAKRVKGCLKESAIEIVEMFENSGIKFATNGDIEMLFGKPGQMRSSMFSFPNCYLSDYESNRKWLEWLKTKYQELITKEIILGTFTITRQQTAIDNNGIAKVHSLRTKRVLKKGSNFSGKIECNGIEEHLLCLLSLAVSNLRYMGTNRNRGFGCISCNLFDENNISLNKKYINHISKVI